MATDTVTVSFTALPEHVRTARFIAASVARRAGVSEGLLDEIRLAVSEACSLAVRQHRVFAPAEPVELTMTENPTTFAIRVCDAVARQRPTHASDDFLQLGSRDPILPVDPAPGLSLRDDDAAIGSLEARERIGLAVISGLVDDVEVDYGAAGAAVTMRWPLGGSFGGSPADRAGETGNAPVNAG